MSDKISPGVSATLSNGLVVWFWVGLSLLVSVTSEGNDVMWFIKGLAVRLLLLGVFACFNCILFRFVYCSGYNFEVRVRRFIFVLIQAFSYMFFFFGLCWFKECEAT